MIGDGRCKVATLSVLPGVACGLLAACESERQKPVAKPLVAYAKTAVRHLPSDSALLVGVDLEQVRATPLSATLPHLLRWALPTAPSNMAGVCDLDPNTMVSHVVVSFGQNLIEREQRLAVLAGRFDKQQVGVCLALAATKLSRSLVATDRGPLTLYSDEDDGIGALVYWPSPALAIVAPDAIRADSALQRSVDADTSLSEQPVFQTLLPRTDTSAAAWAVGPVPQHVHTALAPHMGHVPRSFFASITLDDPPTVRVTLRYVSKRAATSSERWLRDARRSLDSRDLPIDNPILAKLLEERIRDIQFRRDESELELSTTLGSADIAQLGAELTDKPEPAPDPDSDLDR